MAKKKVKLTNPKSFVAPKQADAETIFQTGDSFQNFSMRAGVTARGEEGSADNLLTQGHYQFNLLTRNRVQLEAAYRGSWIVGRVVDSIAEDMTKAGISLTTNEEDAAKKVQDFQVYLSRLQIWSSLCDTIKWGRLYGGAVAVMQIEGQQLNTPLKLDTVTEDQFKGLVVYDRWQLWPVLDKLIEIGPDMGLPAYYDIVLGSNLNDPSKLPGGQEAQDVNGRVRVHYSRCIRFGGHKLPFFQAITEMMWEESVLERMWDRLIEFDTTNAETAGLVQRANLRMVGIDKLRQIIASGGKAMEALLENFEMIRKFQSNQGITLLDKEDVYNTTSYAFSGLDSILIQFAQQLSGSCEIPMVRLFGQSPVGMNATGESDLRNYYDGIQGKQESAMRNGLEDLISVAWRSKFGEEPPEDLSFEFVPLWQISAPDKATMAKTLTDTISEAHQEGAIDTATMMKELKQLAPEIGVFTHITDEMINEAENEEPPLPDAAVPSDPNASPQNTTGDPGEGPTHLQEKPRVEPAQDKKGKDVKDSAWKKIKKFITGDRGVEATIQEFEKGKLKSSSGKKVTSKKQALAIGYSEAGEDGKMTDDQKYIRDWLAKK